MAAQVSRTRCQFQSTLPARGATTFGALKDMIENISIHAPRTGSDIRYTGCVQLTRDFNPRSPHGERQRRN